VATTITNLNPGLLPPRGNPCGNERLHPELATGHPGEGEQSSAEERGGAGLRDGRWGRGGTAEKLSPQHHAVALAGLQIFGDLDVRLGF
jgi:hypothetical protein